MKDSSDVVLAAIGFIMLVVLAFGFGHSVGSHGCVYVGDIRGALPPDPPRPPSPPARPTVEARNAP